MLSEKGELIAEASSAEAFKPLSRCAQIPRRQMLDGPAGFVNGKLYARNARVTVLCGTRREVSHLVFRFQLGQFCLARRQSFRTRLQELLALWHG